MMDPGERANSTPEADGEGLEQEGWGIGPLYLVVPALFLVLGILWSQRGQRHPEQGTANPPETRGGTDVAGFTARHLDGEGRAIDLTLVPLHESGPRQTHDARVLRGRFGLGPEAVPWRLAIVCAKGTSAVDLDLVRLRVEDADGLALAPLDADERVGELLADPLVVLMQPYVGPLAVGEEIGLVLFGRAPGTGAFITGFGSGEPIALTARAVPRAEIIRSLARLDRPSQADGGSAEAAR